MKLKRFEALTLQGALESVKAELGPDAVIVSTRRVNKGGGLFGLLSQPVVEVTAAVDRQTKKKQTETTILERIARSHEAADPTPVEVSSQVDAVSETPRGDSFHDQLRMATMLDPFTEQLTAVREELKRLREERNDPESVVRPLRQELEGLRIIVGEALGDRMRKQVDALPGNLTSDYEALVSQGVQPQLAHELLRSVVETLGTAGIKDRVIVEEMLQERIEQAISTSGSFLPTNGLQKIVMLVGPTGVGKTTTVAKLASLATQVERPRKTVLITLDTYRIAAVEQLRVFAKILKLPLEVAMSPRDLCSCIARHPEAELILIDTAGRSPRDRTGQEELKVIAEQQLKIETHLVLAAPTTESVLHDVIQQYRSIPIHRLLFTKLDEITHYGKLFNLLHYTGLPLSYVSMGQRVPEDLELASSRRVVELLKANSGNSMDLTQLSGASI
ncbi:MAG: flagellar biosynthesis protein FlhF [Nitrospirales bacterium]|nr:flagellar biosynthesis protein FlhF [Nitrospira sp.]MDR4502290.1 flagellar biosynthesis protein FlhF [Nitrospirales bacterium]